MTLGDWTIVATYLTSVNSPRIDAEKFDPGVAGRNKHRNCVGSNNSPPGRTSYSYGANSFHWEASLELFATNVPVVVMLAVVMVVEAAGPAGEAFLGVTAVPPVEAVERNTNC